MASRGMIAGIQAEALKRVEAATAEIVALLGITVPPAAPHARQPELREAYELERQADLLEKIAAATGAGNEALQARIAQLEIFITDSKLEVPEAPITEEEPHAETSEDDDDPESNAGDAPDPDDGHGEPVADPPPDAAGDPPVAPSPYEGLSFADLKAQAEVRGLQPGRSKATAIEVLTAADAAGVAQP